MHIVNTKSPPKYSIEELPGDSWEKRRTKQTVRAIIRAKNEMNVTTEALASACNKYLGEPDSVKPATLNGLFAGKRESISLVEVQMFAAVLYMSVVDLLYPAGENIEIRPGEFASSPDALGKALSPPVLGVGMRSLGRAEAVLNLLRRIIWLEDATARAIWAIRTQGESTVNERIQRLIWEVSSFNDAFLTLEVIDEKPLTVPSTVDWALENQDAESITPSFILTLEPRFEGQSVGNYKLNGHSDVEHPEAP